MKSFCTAAGLLAGSIFLVSPPPALSNDNSSAALQAELRTLLDQHPGGIAGFAMPRLDDLAGVPQDPDNPLTVEKIMLGQQLFHDTAVGTESADPTRRGQYVCASCHNAGSGFKPGIPQGIADGGSGFGENGRGREMLPGMVPGLPADHVDSPDIQPIAVPANLNSAYQDVALWNGELGSSPVGANAGLDVGGGPDGLLVNKFGLPGLETQVLAGTRVHRLRFDNDSVLQTLPRYRRMYDAAFPNGDTGFIPEGSEVTPEALGAAKAIAAYERVILARRAPFQRWLHNRARGSAMSIRQLQGAIVFFDPDRGNCAACHTGPALSTRPGASAEEVFRAVGFPDFDTSDPRIHGEVPESVTRGRGGFTGNPNDDYKFKVPQLYNLRDAPILGHGASFETVREVVEYKVNGVPATDVGDNLDREFRPLDVSPAEVDVLVEFVENALYDPALYRYVPRNVVSGNCFPVADLVAVIELGC